MILAYRTTIRHALAAYFLVIGAFGLRSLFVGAPVKYREFSERTTAFKVGSYLREFTFCALDITVGTMILLEASAAKVLGIAVLAAGIVYSARGFAWGFSGGKPSVLMWILSLAGFALWNGFLIYLMFRVL